MLLWIAKSLQACSMIPQPGLNLTGATTPSPSSYKKNQK
jgi:hypothetical protein